MTRLVLAASVLALICAASGPASGAGTNVVASPEARLQAALDQLLASANGSTAQNPR